MNTARPFHIGSLLLFATIPATWLACGGESKPPESPASETPSAEASAASSDSATPPEPAASSAEPAKADTGASAGPSAESAPPPAPPLGSTDCGTCIDKICAKQAAACGKNTDCQATLDSIRSCSSGAASCIAAGTAPTGAKPKKLAAAYESCAKKALKAKACKATCQ